MPGSDESAGLVTDLVQLDCESRDLLDQGWVATAEPIVLLENTLVQVLESFVLGLCRRIILAKGLLRDCCFVLLELSFVLEDRFSVVVEQRVMLLDECSCLLECFEGDPVFGSPSIDLLQPDGVLALRPHVLLVSRQLGCGHSQCSFCSLAATSISLTFIVAVVGPDRTTQWGGVGFGFP